MIRWFTLLLVLLTATCALAEIETQTLSISNGGLTDFYATLDIPQHDAVTKGDLLSVSLQVEAVIDGHFFYENLGASTGAYQINDVSWGFTGDFQGGTLVSQAGSMSHPLTMVAAYDGVTDYAGPSGAQVPYVDDAAATASWLPADAVFGDFLGTDTVPMDVSTTVLTNHTVYGGQATSGFSTNTTWTVTITYEYDPLSVATDSGSWDGIKAMYR